MLLLFQSTPPIRVATIYFTIFLYIFFYFNPRHPYGWRHSNRIRPTIKEYFNPRHPYGWRRNTFHLGRPFHLFQSTPPIRVATVFCCCFLFFCCIFQSTPPIRVATALLTPGKGAKRYFNPRHPYGWRPSRMILLDSSVRFQSTPPIRVATVIDQFGNKTMLFQSTPPIRVATTSLFGCKICDKISIHATHTGGDTDLLVKQRLFLISIHATHTGGDAALLHIVLH